MGQFACIQFQQNNILTSKKAVASITTRDYLNLKGYHVDVPFLKEELTPKQWIRLEEQLDEYDIEYIAMEQSEVHGFLNKRIASDKYIRPYLAKPILDYIFKYNLCKKNKLFWKIGIIGGKVEQMMGVLGSLLNDISDLTIFSDTPYMYKDLLEEIYQISRLRAKCVVPCSVGLKDMDIVFDCCGQRDYAKWCSPKAIYIDFNAYYKERKPKFTLYPPIIWSDFDIRCDRQLIPVEILQGIFYVQGISKRSIPLTFKKINLSIARPYASCIS